MDVNKTIDQITAMLGVSTTSKEVFRSTIDSLNQSKRIWSADTFIIGMVGVTSSGKSSVLNALMGEELLPVKVKPSTGVLTQVKRGDNRKAAVRFLNATIREVLNHDLTKELIGGFADEEHNPGNTKSVENIEIEHPGFLYDKSVIIIDSPGLDAYGHQGHETITLQQMMPLLDACLIVVPFKPNSDKGFLEYIRYAVYLGKPVLVLQNMKDAVQAEKQPDGTIRKSKEKVLQEHIARTKYVIEQSEINTSRVHIIQFSAKQALDARISRNDQLRIESGLNELERVITGFVENRKPTVNSIRIKSLVDFLRQRVLPEEKTVAGQKEASKRVLELQAPEKIKEKFSSANQLYESIKDKLNHAVRRYDAYCAESPGHEEGARNLIHRFREELRELELCVAGMNGKLWDVLADLNRILGKQVHLNAELNYQFLDTGKGIYGLTHEEARTRTVEREPNWGWEWVKSKFGKRYYEQETYIVDVYRSEGYWANLKEYFHAHRNQFKPTVSHILREFEKQLDVIKEEIPRYEADYRRDRNKLARSEEILGVYNRLGQLVREKENELAGLKSDSKTSVEIHRSSAIITTLEISRSTLSLLTFLQNATRQRLLYLFVNIGLQAIVPENTKLNGINISTVLNNLNSNLSDPQRKAIREKLYKGESLKYLLNDGADQIKVATGELSIVVAGWSSSGLQGFLSRFLHISCEEEIIRENPLRAEPFNGAVNAVVANLQYLETDGLYLSNQHELWSNAKVVVLLLNAMQFGNTMKLLESSRFIKDVCEKKIPVLAVIDSFDEAVLAESLGQIPAAHLEMVRHLAEKGVNIRGHLVNHDNPLLTHMLHEIMMQEGANETTRMEILTKLTESYDRHFKKTYIPVFNKSLINIGRN